MKQAFKFSMALAACLCASVTWGADSASGTLEELSGSSPLLRLLQQPAARSAAPNPIAVAVPQVTQVSKFSINSAGSIVGAFVSGGLIHGFVRSGETFTTVDVPGAKSTIVTDINTAGDMCGIWLDANNDTHGFVNRAGISLLLISLPEATRRLRASTRRALL